MKLLVTGGRDFDDRQIVLEALDAIHTELEISLVIHGAARGADRLADEWVSERGIPQDAMSLDWKRHGRGAGLIRNTRMLELQPELCVAFPGGRGTADMVRKARHAGIGVREIR